MARERRSAAWIAACATIALGVVFGLHRIVDPDVFQQVAVGRAILADPSSIGTSSFHHTVPAYGYIADKWLASVAVAIFQAVAGQDGLMLYQILLCVGFATCAFTTLRIWGGAPWVAASGAALALFGCAFRLEPRPDTLSLALTLVVAGLVRSRVDFRRLVWLLPSIFAIWVNLHGYFVIGLFVLAAGTVAAVLGDRRVPAIGRSLALLALSTAACCVHPQGVHALAWPIRQLRMLGDHPFLRQAILEFQPTELLFLGFGALHGSLLGLAVALGLAGALGPNRRRAALRIGGGVMIAVVWVLFPPPGMVAWPYRMTFGLWIAAVVEIPRAIRERNVFGVLLFAGASVLAVPLIRNLSLVPPAAMLLLVPVWTAVSQTLRVWRVARLVPAVAALALVAGTGWARLDQRLGPGTSRAPARTGWGVDRQVFPVEAADFIERERPPGRLLNHFDNGGYLLYRFHPERKVLISGNTSMYPPEFFREFHREVIGANADPDRMARLFDARLAVCDHGAPEADLLVGKLANSPGWKLIHVDPAASVFLYADESREVAPDARVAVAAAAVAEAEGDVTRSIATLEAAWASDDNDEVGRWFARALFVRGLRRLDAGLRDQGRVDLVRSVELSPVEPGPWLALAKLDAEEGDLASAADRLRHAVDLGDADGRSAAAIAGDPVLRGIRF